MQENVIATKEKLKSLKEKLALAMRGHDLLKNKCDELTKFYASCAHDAFLFRLKVEDNLQSVVRDFTVASSFQSSKEVLREFLLQANIFSLDFGTTSKLGIQLPDVVLKKEDFDDFPYAFASSNILFDDILDTMKEVFISLVKLSKMEKTCQILSREIEMLKKRVNSLEYFQIPDLKNTISYISMKIEENNTYNIVRLLKAKELNNKN